MFKYYLFFIVFLFTSFKAQSKLWFFAPSDTNYYYEGRFDFSNLEEPTCSYPTSSISAKFFGTELSVYLTDYGEGGEKHTNYVEVIIDKRRIKTLELKPGKHKYLISEKLPLNFHTLKLVKRTEAFVGKIGFNGTEIDDKKLYPIKRKSIRMMVIGDSWSTGYGNELFLFTDIETGFHAKNQDASECWGTMVAQHYKASVHNISCSSVGVMQNEHGDTSATMVDKLNRIHPYDSTSKWNHDDYQPHVIYVFLGYHDFVAEEEHPKKFKVDSAQYITRYFNFIRKLLELYPNAVILCMEGGSKDNFRPYGLKQKTRWREYTRTVVDFFSSISEPVFFYEVTNPIKYPGSMRHPWGEDWNPSKPIHMRIAYEVRVFFPLVEKSE